MEIVRKEPQSPSPCPRGHVATVCIRAFKGRKEVLVHLFRPQWDPAEEGGYPWAELVREDAAGGRGNSRDSPMHTGRRAT